MKFIATVFHGLRHRLVRSYLQRHVLRELDLPIYNKPAPTTPTVGERTAWVLWWQGLEAAPSTVQLCMNSIDRNLQGFTTQVLSAENYTNFSEVDPFITKRYIDGSMTLTHYSNFIRLSILRQRGGVWVDATILVPSPTVLPEAADGLITRRGPGSATSTNVARARWSTYLIGGPRELAVWQFVEDFLKQYWRSHTTLLDYHLFDHAFAFAYELNLGGFRDSADQLPILSPDIHELNRVIDQPLSTVALEELFATNRLFKLSWKTSPESNIKPPTLTVREALLEAGLA